MAQKAARILGPYANGANYRLVVVDGTRRKSITATTRDEARRLQQRLLGELHTRHIPTVGEVLNEYIEQRVRERGILPPTITELRRLTQDFLPASATVDSITPDEARRLYSTLSGRQTVRGTPISPNTHHVMLRRARALFRFVVERGYSTKNPFEHVKTVGQSRAGKTQLTIDEARVFKALALKRAQEGDEAALGVLLLLLLGLRASEVLARQVRDVDDDARVLWVQRGKTRNARRRLEVPEEIREPLRQLLRNKESSALIFGTNRQGGVRNKAFLWFKVRSLCDAARVPRVCSHSLRGLHSTLALEAGATPHLVAAALGHSSFRITARHYADPNTLLNTRTRQVTNALQETPASDDSSCVIPDANIPRDQRRENDDCPHSLRGLHSSLAVARGASSRFVAEALGHGSDTITKRHYIAPEALAGATVKRVSEVLTDSPPRRDLTPLREALRSLSSEELDDLFTSLRSPK